MVHQKQAPTAYPAVGVCFWFARSEDSNSCGGDRRLRRKQGAEAGAAVAEAAARPRGASRCGHRNPYSARRPLRRAKRLLRSLFSLRESPPGNAAVGRIWREMPTAYPAVGACFWFARSEDSNSCGGDRRLRRKQGAEAGAVAAEMAARRRILPSGAQAFRQNCPHRKRSPARRGCVSFFCLQAGGKGGQKAEKRLLLGGLHKNTRGKLEILT